MRLQLVSAPAAVPHQLDLGKVATTNRFTFFVDLPEVLVVVQPFWSLVASFRGCGSGHDTVTITAHQKFGRGYIPGGTDKDLRTERRDS